MWKPEINEEVIIKGTDPSIVYKIMEINDQPYPHVVLSHRGMRVGSCSIRDLTPVLKQELKKMTIAEFKKSIK